MSIPVNASKSHKFFASLAKFSRLLTSTQNKPNRGKQGVAFLGLTALLLSESGPAEAHCGADMSMSSSQEDETR